jgi:hypothetical protein
MQRQIIATSAVVLKGYCKVRSIYAKASLKHDTATVYQKHKMFNNIKRIFIQGS